MRHKKALLQPETVQERLAVLMGDPVQLEGDARPVITAHYRSSFNATDRFDTYLGHIPVQRRVASIDHLSVLSVIRMTLVNAYSIYQTHSIIADIDPSAGIKAFVEEVRKALEE